MFSIQAITLGCSKNTVDTDHLLAQLPADGFVIYPEDADPDYVDCILLNTCAFIADAKEESVTAILAAVERKKAGRAGSVFVFGCLSQRYSSQMPELIPEVDAWFGARDLAPVCRALGVEPGDMTLRRRPESGYAYLKISEGCDRRCSYCAIPFIRGPHHSVPMETLLQEASALADRGVHELVLIAQDTTAYGLDLYGRRCLADLLRSLSRIPGIEWLRIHYSYPDDFPDDVLEEMAVNPKLCKYLDIPLQHISDPVLRAMRRQVSGDRIRALIGRLRERVPGVVLRTTLIVGHPGEGPEQFRQLLDFVFEARFERLGAFRYSEEEGTWGALHLADDVPAEEKDARYDALMELQSGISLDFNLSRVGSVERVMVDAVLDGGRTLVCRSRFESPEVDGEIIVTVPEGSAAPAIGEMTDVRITGADLYDLTAELI